MESEVILARLGDSPFPSRETEHRVALSLGLGPVAGDPRADGGDKLAAICVFEDDRLGALHVRRGKRRCLATLSAE